MIERIYKCDLCSDTHNPHDLVGIQFDARGVINKQVVRQVEHHLCSVCLSSLQKLPPICVHGIECTGGPHCTSDHK